MQENLNKNIQKEFSGNIFILHAYDVGDDINLEAIEDHQAIIVRPLNLPKYFKDYHVPLEVEVPHPHEHSATYSAKVHNFGAISLTYKIPFECTLEELRADINDIENKYLEYSISDASAIFKKIRKFIVGPKFFLMRNSYLVIQIDPTEDINIYDFKEQYGNIVASLLRFESENLSEYQKNEILESAMGYYKGDFIVIDTEAALMVDDEYKETLDLFEFANIQQLELKFFDKVLNQQLSAIYEKKLKPVTFKAYLPFVGNRSNQAVEALERLKVDISVITERLESSIMTADDVFFSDVYETLESKLDLKNWQASIDRKLAIIKDVLTFYKGEIDSTKEDILSVLIIILIFIELIVGILHLVK